MTVVENCKIHAIVSRSLLLARCGERVPPECRDQIGTLNDENLTNLSTGIYSQIFSLSNAVEALQNLCQLEQIKLDTSKAKGKFVIKQAAKKNSASTALNMQRLIDERTTVSREYAEQMALLLEILQHHATFHANYR